MHYVLEIIFLNFQARVTWPAISTKLHITPGKPSSTRCSNNCRNKAQILVGVPLFHSNQPQKPNSITSRCRAYRKWGEWGVLAWMWEGDGQHYNCKPQKWELWLFSFTLQYSNAIGAPPPGASAVCLQIWVRGQARGPELASVCG